MAKRLPSKARRRPVVPPPPEIPNPVRRAVRPLDVGGGGAVDLAQPDQALVKAAGATPPPAKTADVQETADEKDRKVQLHKDALDKFRLAASAIHDQRQRELDDLNFELDQWPEEYRKERAGGRGPDGRIVPSRPCLEINKLDQPIEQVLNEARDTRLGIQIKAKGQGADKATANVRQGMIRAIEVESRAQIARNWALNRAAKCGMGFYRVSKKYANDGDNDLDLVIERLLNQHTVYLDPFAKEPDWSDGEWAFITNDLPESEFKRRFPDSVLSSADSDTLKALGDQAPGWISMADNNQAKAYRVAEHYYVVKTKKMRVHVNGGTNPRWCWTDDVSDSEVELIDAKREVEVRQVKWCMLDAGGILDEEEWEGRYIPIIPVIGKEYNVNSKRVFKGIISNAKDAQRSYNVMRSRQLEAIGLASLSTWVMAEGQDEGYEEQWDRANTSAFTRMIYKPTTFDGHLTEAPHRDTAEPAIMAITQGVREADNDIQATTSRWAPSLGRAKADQSGRAIHELKMQGEAGTSTYLDNLATIAMVYEGRVLNDLLEYVYDRPGRVVRIIGDEDEESDVMLGQPYTEEGDDKSPQALNFPPHSPLFNPDQGHKFYDLKDGGQYRVVVTIGPSAPTQQEADRAFMSDVAQAAPTLVPIFADLWVRASGSKVADQIADRLKRNSPFAKGDDEGQQVKIPPAIQAQMQQQQQALQQASAMVKQLQGEIATEQTKARATLINTQAELASKERIAAYEIKRDLIIARAKIDAEYRGQMLDASIDQFVASREQDHEVQLQREMAVLNAVLNPPPQPGAEAGA